MRFDPGENVATVRLADARVRKAVRLIDLEINDARLSVAHVAGALGLSERRLREIFTAGLGVGPKQYICESRLRAARALLEASSLSVKEAMAASGFSDPSHFSRQYKRLFGAPPSKSRDLPG
ncbi:MAG: helix-turn-helix domain-containing protein [Terriglobia bacterium]